MSVRLSPSSGDWSEKGLPPACAITYMLAAPIVNPVTFLSTQRL